MSNTVVDIQKIIFDVSDEQLTKVTVEIKHNEPENIALRRKYEKTYPARITVEELITKYIFNEDHYLLW